MIDDKGVAVEGADEAQFQFAVAIEIQQNGIAGRCRKQLFHFPVGTQDCRRIDQDRAFFAADQCCVMTAVSDLAVTVVFQHPVSDEIQFEKIFVIESGKILRQDCSEAGTREAPVVFVFMTGLQAADEQIITLSLLLL